MKTNSVFYIRKLTVILFILALSESGFSQYCTPTSADPINACYEWIAKVTIGSFSNSSGTSSIGYTDFTSQMISVNPGTTYDIELEPGFLGSSYIEVWKIWIDFNADGDFTDSNEDLYVSPSSNGVVTGTITIPSGVSGVTRLRVAMKYGGTPGPCEIFAYGEVEDYTINISGGGGTPSLSVENVSVSEDAGTAYFNITMDQASAQTVTGQYSTNNGSATAGNDFTAASGSFSISAGQTSTNVGVNITDDATAESTETFSLSISNVSNATITDNTGTCTITDNDTGGTGGEVTSVNGETGDVVLNLSGSQSGTNRTINITGTGNGTTFNVADNDNSSTNELQTLSINGDQLTLSDDGTITLPTGSTDDIWTDNGTYINYLGKVAINSPADPGDYMLAVNGKIKAKEIVVETANWPDYVFEKDYKRKELFEIESFIKRNNHLPGIPPAHTIEKEGVALGELNKQLLQKIEELTLYLIEFEKIYNKQAQRIKELEVIATKAKSNK